MKDQFKQIRGLLNYWKPGNQTASGAEGQPAGAKVRPEEIHGLVGEIVDDLQPLLTAYQAGFYWYLFRHSIVEHANPLIRTTSRRLQQGVLKPKRGVTVSPSQVRASLQGLERIGALRREAVPRHDGTLYRVLLPGEIEACRKLRSERAEMARTQEGSEAEIDCYNVRENRRKVYERDGYICRYCEKQLTQMTATLDHVTPVAAGGGNELQNLVTACLACNSRKKARPVGDFLVERQEELEEK